MADPNFTILDSEDVALAEFDGGYVDPGAEKAFEFQYQNTSGKSLTNIVHCPYPGIQNDIHENTINNPILGIEIIRQSATGSNQTATLAKESADSACTAFEQRVKCYEYIGGTHTERATGAVNFMAAAGDKVILLCDRKICAINVKVNGGTPGSYTGFYVKFWNGSSYAAPAHLSDGTSGMTQDGIITWEAADVATWEKKKITGTGITEPVTGYPIEFGCTAVTTQAVTEAAGLYWEYAYELPKHFLKGVGEYYLYTAPSTYTQIYPEFEYANLGLIAFEDDPFGGGGDAIRCNIEYKLPQDGLYEIVATNASTVTVEKDGGGASAGIGVQTGLNPITGNYYLNKNVVAGMNVVFDTLVASDAGNFTVSEALRYIDWSDDDSTYYNNDIPLSNMADDQKQTVYGIFSPPMDSQESANEVYFEFFVEGE
jgi:hypothetical protein